MSAPQRPPPKRWQIAAAMIVLTAIWGSAWLVIKDGLEHLPPLLSAGARFSLAGLVMIAVAAALHAREGGEDPPTWLWLTVGTTNFAIGYGVVYVVQQVLPSGLVSVLWGIYPLMMAVCGHLFLPGERLRPVHGLGFALGFLGLLALFHHDLELLGWRGRSAALVLLISPSASALGTSLLKRHGGGVSSLKLNRNAMLLGGALLLLASTVAREPLRGVWEPSAVAGLVYLAIFGTVVTLGLYYWVLRYVKASRLSLIAYLTPAIALALGWALAGEPIYPTTIVGAVLIVGGIGFATGRTRRTEG